MKKISNEVKVGATAFITILVFIWLYNFLKGKDLFTKDIAYYSVYDNIGGLGESSPIEVNGFQVGVVQSVDFADPVSGKILVKFLVHRGVKIPKNTVAQIVPVSLLGGMKVQFIYGKGPGNYSAHDTIPGILAASLLDKIDTEFLPLKDQLSDLISVLDSVTRSVDEIMNNDFKKNINGTVANLNNTSRSLNNIIGSKENDLKTTIESINHFTKMLSDNSVKMNKTFSNLESISDSLASADINKTIINLKSSLEKTSVLMENLNKGKGTAGQLMTNDTLYTNLSNSLASLDLLLKDLKENPKRYVHFSIFGKKSASSK
jgi:phospholipid/cholesterol/gamma-HCH transport system substrate-binding protein